MQESDEEQEVENLKWSKKCSGGHLLSIEL